MDCMSRRGPWRILWDLVLPKFNKWGWFLKVARFYLEGISSAIERDKSSLLELITTFGTPWCSLSLPLRIKLIRSVVGGRHTCKARTILPGCRFPSVPYHRRSVQIFEEVIKWLFCCCKNSHFWGIFLMGSRKPWSQSFHPDVKVLFVSNVAAGESLG